MNNEIINIKNLNKSFKNKNIETKTLDNISLTFNKNEFITIIGPSGCGKSTLLSILSNLDKDYSGKIIKNDNIKIGYMLQNDCLLPWRTVLDNCLLGLEIKKEKTNNAINNVKEKLKEYGLIEFLNSYPNELSGGMKQRVALIRTLATNPDVILLDEPFSALDYQTRLLLSNDIYKMFKKEKKTIIMVTHDISEAISLSDKIIVLTKRPAKVKKIYEIQLTNKKDPISNRNCKEFIYYFDKIWGDLN